MVEELLYYAAKNKYPKKGLLKFQYQILVEFSFIHKSSISISSLNLQLKANFLLTARFTYYKLKLEDDFQLNCANKLEGHIWYISGIMSNIDIA